MMRKLMYLTLAVATALLVNAPVPVQAGDSKPGDPNQGQVVIANRGSGTISIIDVATDQVTDTLPLPGETAEPMYVVYVQQAGRVFVGDRANNRVAVFAAKTLELETTVPAGAGVFHMWADAKGTQLWINNDIDNSATVIDPKTLAVISTVPMPADLIEMGGKPHDVVLDNKAKDAFVTFVGFPGDHDYVVKFDLASHTEVARAEVGKDPHVSLTRRNNLLYVPAQGSDIVTLLDRDTLAHVDDIPVPGAHGAGMRLDGRVFYTTNLPGGGPHGLVAIDTASNSVIGAVDTPYPVPHNIALTKQGDKLYVTHSGGAAQTVSVYTASADAPVPVYLTSVTVGLNPFGLAFVR